MKICLFGGSFAPVHNGHLMIAGAARKTCGIDRLIFLPAACSPFKTTEEKYFTDEERLDMLRLATEGLEWAEISELDLQLPPPSWSWRIVEHMRAAHPQAELCWLMGTDQWQQLHRWARYDYLVEQLTFIVYHREEAPEPRPGVRAEFTGGVLHPASSSAIRQALAENRAIPAGWLPERVEARAREIWQLRSSKCD